MMYNEKMLESFSKEYAERCQVTDKITAEMFDANGVLRGLRDKNGNGVVAGLTNISKIEAFRMENGQKIPCDGNLWYRGYNVIDLVKGFEGKRCGFEEVAYLLLFGELPSGEQLYNFCEALATARHLPTNFTRDVIMKAPSADLMNSLTRSVLTLASYDDDIRDTSLQNVLMQCMKLISEMPMLAVYGYHAYNHYVCDESLYIHRPQPDLSTAENILLMLRPDKKYTELEAQVLLERFTVELARVVRMLEDALDLGCEDEAAVLLRVVKRLDAEEVARAEELAGGAVPDGEREHAAQLIEQVGAVFFKAVQQHFAVRFRCKYMACL